MAALTSDDVNDFASLSYRDILTKWYEGTTWTCTYHLVRTATNNEYTLPSTLRSSLKITKAYATLTPPSKYTFFSVIDRTKLLRVDIIHSVPIDIAV